MCFDRSQQLVWQSSEPGEGEWEPRAGPIRPCGPWRGLGCDSEGDRSRGAMGPDSHF